MTLDEVAEYLRLSRSKLYDLAQGARSPAPRSPVDGASIARRSSNGCSRSARVGGPEGGTS
ncbi:MAG: helix-turn-helix domain-containing protein [Deltaproteobacteria bacterium]|nr:helix-turn-helix domain-containing protein [Deltaproteobacteria bacterium]